VTAGKVAVILLRQYQRWISPLLPASCRYSPTCSAFAIEAIELHGLLRGSRLAAWRIVRCNPWSRGGFDPVPAVRRHRRIPTTS
jgi:putative membrane protein insertion efficiency factor